MELHRILYADPRVPPTKHGVTLTAADRQTLRSLVAAGVAPTRTLTHARILLKADAAPAGPGWTDVEIRTALDVSLSTIGRVRRACREHGLAAALHRRPPAVTRPRKVDGRQEAHLAALACSTPPIGHTRWTLRLLTDRFIELEGLDLSDETVRRVLKKKPAQAVVDAALVHPTRTERPLRLPDGGRARRLSSAV